MAREFLVVNIGKDEPLEVCEIGTETTATRKQ